MTGLIAKRSLPDTSDSTNLGRPQLSPQETYKLCIYSPIVLFTTDQFHVNGSFQFDVMNH